MNIWVKHLLNFKFYPERLKAGNTSNAFKYLLSPTDQINVLSNTHRRLISKNVLQQRYSTATFTDAIIGYFKPFVSKVKDKRNITHLITRILYTYKSDWQLPERPTNSIEKDIADIVQGNLGSTEKETLILARIGQGKFRNDLINKWKGCTISGYPETSLLVASHIKPWSKCDHIEKLDPDNGLLLIPNYDKLFDRGLISFKENGSIIFSDLFSDSDFFDIDESITIDLNEGTRKYMEYHRKHVLKNS
ncbi:hypothetical protein C5749_01715 [Sphingobacterium gobiense]|uniref:HNH nuclease domain-containing protein n=2 Tax=Sphingobacterium gobiense TaxID=1382456 RepID=A0A2S9JVQ7_9SPHI|nr:hypothetical protein C5749_01715 [Sphingobacterium gobiense]